MTTATRSPIGSTTGKIARILVVDENADERGVCVQYLSSTYFITDVSGPAAALRMLRGGSRFALLITEVMMQAGSGIDLVREAWAIDRGMQVVMTGSSPLLLAEARSYGHVALVKPYSGPQLHRVVSDALGPVRY